MTEVSLLNPVFRIIPTVQNYDWGKLGYSSKVVQLLGASSLQASFHFDKNSPYAEVGFASMDPSLAKSWFIGFFLAMDGHAYKLTFEGA
jgi:hypothetical protein